MTRLYTKDIVCFTNHQSKIIVVGEKHNSKASLGWLKDSNERLVSYMPTWGKSYEIHFVFGNIKSFDTKISTDEDLKRTG